MPSTVDGIEETALITPVRKDPDICSLGRADYSPAAVPDEDLPDVVPVKKFIFSSLLPLTPPDGAEDRK